MLVLKTALVTGGGGGLGREVARSLAKKGFAVAVHHLASGEAAASLVRELGGECTAVRADLRRPDEVDRMVEEIRGRYGRLDAVINNAGAAADSLLIRQPEADWDRVMSTNLTGCFLVMKAMSPIMAGSGGGQIVNISSYSGLKGKEGQAAYSASKAALLGLTRSAAIELAGDNIRVNAVLPGYMATAMGSAAGRAMERARHESLLGRLSDPAEAAEFIAWLAGAAGITGQVFSLDSRIV